MGGSLKLFSVRGIPVRLHVTFLLVIVWAAYIGLASSEAGGEEMLRRVAFTEFFVLMLFACVALHELAHALTAQLLGIKVQDVTLWPLGGLARMSNLPDSPFEEFLITAAGPAMSIFLTLALAGALVAWQGLGTVSAMLASPWRLLVTLGRPDMRSLLLLLVLNNAILAVFNLIPAFPLDGGRMLRALLAGWLPFKDATRLASMVGQGLAVVLFGAGLLAQNLWLALVAVFVFLAAGQERRQMVSYSAVRGLRVRQAMQPIGQRLHPLQTLGQAARQMANSAQSFYLVVDAGRLVGVISRGDVLAGLRQHGPEARVNQQMTRDISRLSPEESLAQARERLLQSNSWLAVVVENGGVVGTLSQGDLNRLADLLNAYPGLLPRDYESGPAGREDLPLRI